VKERPLLKGQIGMKVTQEKIEICDFEDRPAFSQSFRLLSLDEKINECGSSQFQS
jgi:hypothetical protein